jgi:hypothetical protein
MLAAVRGSRLAKLDNYPHDYNKRNFFFLPAVMTTSGRFGGDFLRLLYILSRVLLLRGRVLRLAPLLLSSEALEGLKLFLTFQRSSSSSSGVHVIAQRLKQGLELERCAIAQPQIVDMPARTLQIQCLRSPIRASFHTHSSSQCVSVSGRERKRERERVSLSVNTRARFGNLSSMQ